MDRRAVQESLLRLFLRSLPFMPVPELLDVANALRKSETDLDKQVQQAVNALQQSSSLVADLETKLGERAKKLEELQAEYRRVSALATISEEQARALDARLRDTIGESRRWDILVSLSVNLFAGFIIFVVGVVFADQVKAFFVHR
jgi:hypothetical protein